jgi:ubiquinone/menaquinone biosynthesis C-methylase UbiE
MGIYDRYILPHVINLACGTPQVEAMRQLVVPRSRGQVLEVGMGTGINIPLYRPENIDFVWGLEPALGMRKLAEKRVAAAPFAVRWLDLPGEEIPLDDNSVDTVLLTFTLCTIPDWLTALRQMHRVLKPDGQLLFCEHGLSPHHNVQRWQHRLNPVWSKCAGGCNLNRPTAQYLRDGGFVIEELGEQYVEATPKFAGYVSWGVAHKRN